MAARLSAGWEKPTRPAESPTRPAGLPPRTSPAIGEYALLFTVPSLERRIRELRDELADERAAHARTRAARDELGRRIADMGPGPQPGGEW